MVIETPSVLVEEAPVISEKERTPEPDVSTSSSSDRAETLSPVAEAATPSKRDKKEKKSKKDKKKDKEREKEEGDNRPETPASESEVTLREEGRGISERKSGKDKRRSVCVCCTI